jgi:hypothetical protein
MACIKKVGATFEWLNDQPTPPHGCNERKRDGGLAYSTRSSRDEKTLHG